MKDLQTLHYVADKNMVSENRRYAHNLRKVEERITENWGKMDFLPVSEKYSNISLGSMIVMHYLHPNKNITARIVRSESTTPSTLRQIQLFSGSKKTLESVVRDLKLRLPKK